MDSLTSGLLDANLAPSGADAGDYTYPLPDAAVPDAVLYDAESMDSTWPDAAVSDAGVFDAERPDAGAAAPPCIAGDARTVSAAGNCYMLFTSVIANWESAQALCALLGTRTHLATSTDANEDALLNALAGDRNVWIGGNDRQMEMTWVWANGEPMIYTHWGDGEPNNTNGEDCLIIRRDVADGILNIGTWDDRDCDRNYGFICERTP